MAISLPFIPTHWYYNTETGQLTQGNNIENLGNNLVGGAGWHELNIPGNATKAQATAEATKEFPKGSKPTTAGITPGRVASTAVNEAADATGISSITGFLSTLGSANLWIRVVKIIAGSVILFIGVAHLTGLNDKVTGIAGKALAAAPLL
jgi:hypothetical protein